MSGEEIIMNIIDKHEIMFNKIFAQINKDYNIQIASIEYVKMKLLKFKDIDNNSYYVMAVDTTIYIYRYLYTKKVEYVSYINLN
jgi:hypothetical protein